MARALLAGLGGDFAEADRLSETARAMVQQTGSTYGNLVWAFQRQSLAYLRGDPSVLTNDAAAMAGLSTPMPMAAVLTAAGQRDEAMRRLKSMTIDPNDLASVVRGALACLTLEDAETAEHLYERATPSQRHHRPHRPGRRDPGPLPGRLDQDRSVLLVQPGLTPSANRGTSCASTMFRPTERLSSGGAR